MLDRWNFDTHRRSPTFGWLVAALLLSCIFLALSVPDLGHYPRVHGDESWVMSASYKLATEGVFGSDLYAGLYDAERHYFIALPVYQFLQAAVFTLIGASITAARAVSIAGAIVVIWATTWLALRWYGLTASIISGVLLVLLRVNLVNLWPGLPLLAVGRSGRYDMTGVAFVWLTVVLLDLALDGPPSRRRWVVVAAGLSAGLATLTQFFGAFTLPIAAAMLLWPGTGRERITSLVRWFAIGWTVVVMPYLAYVAANWADFRGQAVLKAGRTDFLELTFYTDNLRKEPKRYRHLVDFDRISISNSGDWLFVATILPILGWLIWRARADPRTGGRRLLTTFAILGAGLTLFDSTKAPLYAIVLWPACCIAIGAAVADGADVIRHHVRRPLTRTVAPLVNVAVVIGFALALSLMIGSVDAIKQDRQRVRGVSDYADIAGKIDATIPVGVSVVGHERWWWGLHEREYLALNVLQLDWERRLDESGTTPLFVALFDATGAEALIVDDNARSEISRYPADLRQQIETFLTTEAEQVAVIVDPTYGRFEVYLRR